MNKRIKAAVSGLPDYLWDDELRHWHECGKSRKHIFNRLKLLDRVLDKAKRWKVSATEWRGEKKRMSLDLGWGTKGE